MFCSSRRTNQMKHKHAKCSCVAEDLTLSGPAFSVVCHALGGGGGGVASGCQKSRLPSTN